MFLQILHTSVPKITASGPLPVVPKVKPRLHHQVFLLEENLFKVFDANFDSVDSLTEKTLIKVHQRTRTDFGRIELTGAKRL